MENTMKNTIFKRALTALLVVLLPLGIGWLGKELITPEQQVDAQATLTQTILSAAMSTNAQGATDTAVVATATASSSAFSAGNIVFIDKEAMRVKSTYVSGTLVPVLRGQEGTKVMPHAISSVVYVGPASWFTRNDPSGLCTASTGSLSTPMISLVTGNLYTCSTTGTGVARWQATNFVSFSPILAYRDTSLTQTGALTDVFVNYSSLTGPAITYTLPAVTGLFGKMLIITSSAFPSASNITVAPASGTTIGGVAANITLTTTSPVARLISVGGNWVTF